MYQQLRAPERLFRFGQWAVAFLFAFFLIKVGASLIADLPLLSTSPQQSDFLDQRREQELQQQIQPLELSISELQKSAELSQERLLRSQDEYSKDKQSFDNWRAARGSTEQAENNPEVISRVRKLDEQLKKQTAISSELQQWQKKIEAQRDRLQPLQEQVTTLNNQAYQAYQQALYHSSLKAFAIRLLFVAPLLIAAIWLFRRHRNSQHWPFAWGFIFFALFAFFFELVPYLPSFGGYIRYGVGAILTFLGGKALMRALQQYLERKHQEQTAPQEERKQEIRYEKALESMAKGQCPSCERGMPGIEGAVLNYCMHCGLKTHEVCSQCGLRHNAFFPYCPACGSVAAAHPRAATVTQESKNQM